MNRTPLNCLSPLFSRYVALTQCIHGVACVSHNPMSSHVGSTEMLYQSPECEASRDVISTWLEPATENVQAHHRTEEAHT